MESLDAHHKYGSHNAVWVESMFLRGHDPKRRRRRLRRRHLERLAARLTKNGVRYAYLFAGPYEQDGGIPAYAFSRTARASVQSLRSLAPNLVVLPWVGGLQHQTVHLEDPRWVDRAIVETARLIDSLDVSGVHIDLELVLPDCRYVLEEQGLTATDEGMAEWGAWLIGFHRKLRERLPGAFVSTFIPATSRSVRSWKRALTSLEAAELAEHVDQLSLPFYDTSIDDPGVFFESLAEQLRHITEWKRRPAAGRTQCLIGAGTFVNAPELHEYRNLEVESLPSHFAALDRAIDAVQRDTRLVDGSAIYCDWTTSRRQWRELRRLWAEASHS